MDEMNDSATERPIVMVVDDNVANLQSALNTLGDICDVFTAPSAEKMFDLLERNTPMLILLDVNMPNMNGYEVLQLLKANPATRDIPVIFLTGVQAHESLLEGFSLGADDYVLKPFMPQLLHKRVELHIMLWEQKRLIEKQAREIEEGAKKLRQQTAGF